MTDTLIISFVTSQHGSIRTQLMNGGYKFNDEDVIEWEEELRKINPLDMDAKQKLFEKIKEAVQ